MLQLRYDFEDCTGLETVASRRARMASEVIDAGGLKRRQNKKRKTTGDYRGLRTTPFAL
jgi:hypothetical protein